MIENDSIVTKVISFVKSISSTVTFILTIIGLLIPIIYFIQDGSKINAIEAKELLNDFNYAFMSYMESDNLQEDNILYDKNKEAYKNGLFNDITTTSYRNEIMMFLDDEHGIFGHNKKDYLYGKLEFEGVDAEDNIITVKRLVFKLTSNSGEESIEEYYGAKFGVEKESGKFKIASTN